FAGVDLRRIEEGRQTREKAALDRPLGGGFDEVAEHHVPVLAVGCSARPFVQVALQPLVARLPKTRLICTHFRLLLQRRETSRLDRRTGVRVEHTFPWSP